MGPAAIAALQGGASLATGLMEASSARDANTANATMNEQALQFGASQAQIQRDWQERMSNTAYQRQSADMKAAGINPIAGFGSGATTPSGAVASGSAGRSASAVPMNFDKFVTSALDAIKTMSEVNLQHAQTKRETATTKKTTAETPESEVKGGLWQMLLNPIRRFQNSVSGYQAHKENLEKKQNKLYQDTPSSVSYK